MAWWVWTLIGLYGVGFVFTFWLNASRGGMVTLGLCLLRSAFWPTWWAFGWP